MVQTSVLHASCFQTAQSFVTTDGSDYSLAPSDKKAEMGTNSNELPDMYPVRKELVDVLFDGHSKEEKGRYRYLNLRKQIPLEERYHHPVSNSMTYGWKLGETGQKFQAPTYARGKIVEESFYRRNGVF